MKKLTKTTFRNEGTRLPQSISNPITNRFSACKTNITIPLWSGSFVPSIFSELRDNLDALYNFGESSVLHTPLNELNLGTPAMSEEDDTEDADSMNQNNFNEISMLDIPPSSLYFFK